jgi:hypothetical protein
MVDILEKLNDASDKYEKICTMYSCHACPLHYDELDGNVSCIKVILNEELDEYTEKINAEFLAEQKRKFVINSLYCKVYNL